MQRRSYSDLKQMARRTLRGLDLRPPLDHEEFATRLGEQRGKPIHLIASSDLPPTAVFGVTGGDDYQDVILYEARTSTTSQLLIILHELSHIVLDHPRTAVDHSFRSGYEKDYEMFSTNVLTELFGSGDSEERAPAVEVELDQRGTRWRWPWRRSGSPRLDPPDSLYAADIEWEAETMATILLTWIPRYGGYVPPAQNSPMEKALGDDGAW